MSTGLPTIPAMPSARVRDPFLDNARYWVMLLVVMGHFMTPMWDVGPAHGAYVWLYTFHMPVFVMISGYTARRYIGDARQVKRMVSTLVIPYLLVETGLEVLEMWLAGEPITLHVLEPQWLTWFIAALFIWRLTTPIWLAVRWPIAVAVLVSLIGGLSPIGDVLALPQVIGYLPFYVVGMHLRRDHFDQLVKPWVRACSAAALVAAFVVCQLVHEGLTISWLYWRDGYSEDPLNAEPLAGLLNRGSLMALGFVLAFAALAMVPQRKAWFSRFGERTLYPYLLHGFAILWLEDVGFFTTLTDYGVAAALAVAAGAAILTTLLMTKTVARVFRPLFEPDLSRHFRRTAERIDR